MKGLVLGGCGLMGKPITYGLQKLGYDVKTVDQLGYADYMVDDLDCKKLPYSKSLAGILNTYKPDFCVSALPYHLNTSLAVQCINNEVSWFDLGGHVKTTGAINQYAKLKQNCKVMTDLGLAPGLINILGLALLSQYPSTQKLQMYCGGLPSPLHKHTSGPLKYGITWSVEGLVNEYNDRCQILREGDIVTVPALSGQEKLNFAGLGELEAFHTSGGIGTTLDILKKFPNLKDCSYKTMRWPGHRDIIKSLLDGASEAEVVEQLKGSCMDFRNQPSKDMVLIYLRLTGENNTKVKHTTTVQKVVKIFGDSHREDKVISINPKDVDNLKSKPQFSAMQKATGFSCVAAVDCIMQHYQCTNGVHTYNSIVNDSGMTEIFRETLSLFGIKL